MRGGKRQDQAVNEAKGNPGGRKPGKSRAKPAVEKIAAKSSAPTVEAKAADNRLSSPSPAELTHPSSLGPTRTILENTWSDELSLGCTG